MKRKAEMETSKERLWRWWWRGRVRKSAGTQRHDKTAAVNSGKKTSYEHRLKVEISQAVVAITTHEQLHFEFSSCSCRFPTP